MNTEFTFDKGLVRIEAFHTIRLLFFMFGDDFLDKFLRFAFPLHESQDMVDIVRDYVPFINKVYLLYFAFFRNYTNFFLLRKNALLRSHFLVLLNFGHAFELNSRWISWFSFIFGKTVLRDGVGLRRNVDVGSIIIRRKVVKRVIEV